MFKPSMNFHRGFDEWVFIRGQEIDQYRSKIPDIELSKYIPSNETFTEEEKKKTYWEVMENPLGGKRLYKMLERYFANISERRSEEDYFAPRVFREAVRWVSENRDAERFFLMVDSFDPHEPWDPPHEFVNLYDSGYDGAEVITPEYGRIDYLTERELKHMRAHYAGEVTLVDKWFGYFIDKLKELDLYDKSLIIVMSDHGHQLGEHGYTGKVPHGMWPELMDSVLIVKLPENVDSGERLQGLTYTYNAFATILDVLKITIDWKIDAKSLIPMIEGRSDGEEYLTCRFENYVWYRDEENVLICRCDGTEPQLFDIKNDPQEKNNIASQDPQKVKELYSKILEDAKGKLPIYELGARAGAGWYIY